MTETSSPLALINRLELPSPELSTLSFCNSSRAAAVNEWSKKLPVTQISASAALLYQAVREIVKLDTTPLNHFEILENIRPYVQQNIQSLSQQFLGQPLILPVSAMKTAIIAQALQRHMSISYCLVVKELLQSRPRGNFKNAEKQALGLALHRAVTGLGLQFMRSAQIYTQTPPNMWLELNTLYRVAEQLDTLKAPFQDPLLQHCPANTLEHAFMRIALLYCAHPNQLTQQEVKTVYELLDNWSRLANLLPSNKQLTTNDDNLFIIDLDCNAPPQHQADNKDSCAQHRKLNFSSLIKTIEKQREHSGDIAEIIEIPASTPDHLIDHLLKCWSQKTSRTSPRRPNRSRLEIAVGLSSIHFNLLGQVSFQHFIRNTEKMEKFASLNVADSSGDPWDNAFDSEGLGRSNFELGLNLDMNNPNSLKGNNSTTANPYPTYTVQVVDSSSDGYRLDWRGEIPAQVKAGELISLHQSGQDYRIGVIRWAKQHKEGAQIGVEIIAHSVKPCAAQQLMKVGDNNVYMHALLASASSHRDDFNRIITAIHPFKEKQKVNVKEDDQTYSAQLSQLELSTSCINLFSFRPQESAASASAKMTEKPSGDFQSDW